MPVLLMPTQSPQQELMALDQLMASRGMSPVAQEPGAWTFATEDGTSSANIRLFTDLGAFRIALTGEQAPVLTQIIGQYLPTFPPEAVLGQLDQAATTMERQLYLVMSMLLFEDATTAMATLGKKYLEEGPDEIRLAVVQGLAYLETHDVGPILETIAEEYGDDETGKVARKAIAMLSDKGVVTQSESSLLQRVEGLLEEGEAQEALKLLGELKEPSAHRALLEARAHRKLKDPKAALAALEHLDPAQPRAADAFAERASLNEEAGDPSAAQADVDAALALEPAHALAAQIKQRLSLGDGGDDLDSLIEANPDDAALRAKRAHARLGNQNFQGAYEDVKHGMSLQADDTRWPTLLTLAALGTLRYGEALQAANQAATIHTPAQEKVAAALKGRVFLALNDPQRAVAAFAAQATANPEFAEIHLGLGLALEARGETTRATAAYDAATQGGASISALSPILYAEAPLASEHGFDITPVDPPPYRTGIEAPDSMFKRCADCGSLALGRRSSCRECSGREFLS